MNALKTLPAALVAALGVIIAQGADVMPAWLLVVCAALVAGLSVYFMPPGIGLRTPKPGVHKGQGGGVSGDMVLAVFLGATGAGVVLWLLGLLVGRG